MSHVSVYRTKYLAKGDTIIATAEGYITGKNGAHFGALIVTSKLVVFYRKGFFGEVHQSIPLDKLTSIEQSSLLGHRTLKLHTSHDDLDFKTGQSAARYQEIVSAVEAGRAHPASPAVAASPLEALKALGDLRAAGVLTEAEFEEKKKELLKRV